MAVNDLFDSMNGCKKEVDEAKMLKNAVTQDSPHMEFWGKMERKVKSWEFLRKRAIHPPSQDGWLASIKGMQMLWRRLGEEGFLHMNPLNFNQDPLENFFNVVRQNCGGNHRPNAMQFKSAYKTALQNNLVSNQTPGNTKEDGCSVLGNLSSLFSLEGEDSVCAIRNPARERPKILLADSKIVSLIQVCAYFVIAYLKKYNCNACCHLLREDASTIEDMYSTFLFEGLGQVEGGPSEKLVNVARSTFKATRSKLEKEGHESNVSLLVKELVEMSADLSGLSCDIHISEFKGYFISYMSEVAIRKFCIEQNKKMLSAKM